jgi:hypothetical protein
MKIDLFMKVIKFMDKKWLGTLRHYLLFVFTANLIWEVLQLPLYTIWVESTFVEIVFAVVHCTGGDLLIALTCLVTALLVLGANTWSAKHYRHVAILAIILGIIYTIFSEWLNTVVRESWAYSELMPVLPPFGTGLSPLLQWIVIPVAGLWWARRTNLPASQSSGGGN